MVCHVKIAGRALQHLHNGYFRLDKQKASACYIASDDVTCCVYNVVPQHTVHCTPYSVYTTQHSLYKLHNKHEITFVTKRVFTEHSPTTTFMNEQFAVHTFETLSSNTPYQVLTYWTLYFETEN